MDRLIRVGSTGRMTHTDIHTDTPSDLTAPEAGTPDPAPPAARVLDAADVLATVGRRSFATLATVSPAGHPHSAGVLFALDGAAFYVSTFRESRKARNVAAEPRVALTVPVPRMPFAPPGTVQLQGRAEVLDLDHPDVLAGAESGALKAVTRHGELELPGGCFLRITPTGRLHTYGIGMSLLQYLRDPLGAAGHADLSGR